MQASVVSLRSNKVFNPISIIVLIVLSSLLIVGWFLYQLPHNLDQQLNSALSTNTVAPLDFGAEPDPALTELGEALFFDKELSGNRDISCATCHHPLMHSSDDNSLPVGVGGQGLGASRILPAGKELVPRNAPDLFNRGSPEWNTMFWDGRVASSIYHLDTPAEALLPEGLNSVLAAQALFPPTSRDEMRGQAGDLDVFGQPNELANVEDGDVNQIWNGIMDRLAAIPAYDPLFAAAYPDVPAEERTMAHVGNAIAAYEIAAFTFDDSPWDRYMAGREDALSAEAKRGAILFYGKAGCSQCHSGALLTDQDYHNIGIPHLGPGKVENGIDPGRALETNDPMDAYAFRTPPLRNVALTAPYMHNGYYDTLEEAIEHHFDAPDVLASYQEGEVDLRLAEVTQNTVVLRNEMAKTLSPNLPAEKLSDAEMDDLMSFIYCLTAPKATDLGYLVPDSVPSGLPVND